MIYKSDIEIKKIKRCMRHTVIGAAPQRHLFEGFLRLVTVAM